MAPADLFPGNHFFLLQIKETVIAFLHLTVVQGASEEPRGIHPTVLLNSRKNCFLGSWEPTCINHFSYIFYQQSCGDRRGEWGGGISSLSLVQFPNKIWFPIHVPVCPATQESAFPESDWTAGWMEGRVVKKCNHEHLVLIDYWIQPLSCFLLQFEVCNSLRPT